MEFNINYMAVLIAGIAQMVIGFLWYGPLFGKIWQKLSGISDADIKKAGSNMPMLYGTMFLATLVTAYVLSHFQQAGGAMDMMDGAMIGFWAWLGFVATTMLTNVLFDKKPFNLYLLNAGYQLVSLVVMGALLVQFS
jgi:hypothetical protein